MRAKTSVVRRHLTVLHLQHHDRASVLAGKVHALLQRPYEKGRDVFDLFWCLSDPTWPTPNLTLLTNALRQTGWRGDYPSEGTWRALVRRRLQTLHWQRVVADVEPLLEAGVGLELLTLENVMAVLG